MITRSTMKVFNWVHRRFLHVHSGITTLQDDKGMERNGRLKEDIETHALLEHDGHLTVDVLNDWKEGILAIGTLAIGPLEPTITAKCELLLKQVDDHDEPYHYEETTNYVHVLDNYEHDDDDLESSPLMKMAIFSHEFDKIEIDSAMSDTDSTANPYKEIKQAANQDDNVTTVVDHDSKFINSNDVYDVNDERECQVKRRVTLADLFLEESVEENTRYSSSIHHVAENEDYVTGESSALNIKPASVPKNGLSKAKKLLKEELRPIKKLNQFVKRMMRKKIHPDMVEAGKTEKDMRIQPRQMSFPTTHHLVDHGTYESASLRLLQDSTA